MINIYRLKAQDPNRWSYFDEYSTDYYGAYSPMGYGAYGPMGYGVSAYGYYGSLGFGITPWIGFGYCSPMTFWNSYYTWNSFYNPYYGGMIVTNPKVGNVGTVTRLSTFNPSSYTNYAANRGNVKPSSANTPYEYSQTIRRSYNANSYNSYGNNTRQNYFRPSVNSNNTLSNQSRSYSPSCFLVWKRGGGGMGQEVAVVAGSVVAGRKSILILFFIRRRKDYVNQNLSSFFIFSNQVTGIYEVFNFSNMSFLLLSLFAQIPEDALRYVLDRAQWNCQTAGHRRGDGFTRW